MSDLAPITEQENEPEYFLRSLTSFVALLEMFAVEPATLSHLTLEDTVRLMTNINHAIAREFGRVQQHKGD